MIAPSRVPIGDHDYPAWELPDGKLLVDLRFQSCDGPETFFRPQELVYLLGVPSELVDQALFSEPPGFVVLSPSIELPLKSAA